MRHNHGAGILVKKFQGFGGEEKLGEKARELGGGSANGGEPLL